MLVRGIRLTMAKAVDWIGIWEENTRGACTVIVSHEIVSRLDLEARAKAATERRVKIIDAAVYDSYHNPFSVIASSVGVFDTCQIVRAPLAKVRNSSRLNLRAGIDDYDGPQIYNPR